MAAQERSTQLAVADSPFAIANMMNIKHILITPGNATATFTIWGDGAGAGVPLATIVAPANTSVDIHFDSTGGGLYFAANTFYATLAGANSVAYIYES